MIEIKNNEGFKEVDEIKVVDVFESDNEAVFKGSGENLKNYRIYGQTVDGESVGDLVTSGEHAGEYKVLVTVSNGADTLTTPIYLPEPLKMVGDEAEYVDFEEQKQHRVRKNLAKNNHADSSTLFTVEEVNNFIHVSGTNNSGSTKAYVMSRGNVFPAGSYDIVNNSDTTIGYDYRDENDILVYGTVSANSIKTFNFPAVFTRSLNIYKSVPNGESIDNYFQIMVVRHGTDTSTYEPYIENTEVDVTLPALPTLSGTNTLSVNTNTKPSKVWGGLNDPRDILYVKDNLGNVLFSKYHEIEDEPPLTYTAKKAGTLKNYRVYGNTVNSESVGDLVFDGDHAGEYRVPVTINDITTNLYLPEQIRKVGSEAEYIDYGEQKQHRVRKNLLENTATSQTINGVTFTVNNDGTLTLNGQATANTFFTFGSVPINKTLVLTGCPKKGGYSNYLLRAHVRNITLTYEDTGNGIRFNTNVPTYCEIRIASGYTCDNLTFYPMIRKADIEDDTYEPYIENTDLDVTLPALPTIAGTNTLSVGTEVQPAKVMVRGKIKEVL